MTTITTTANSHHTAHWLYAIISCFENIRLSVHSSPLTGLFGNELPAGTFDPFPVWLLAMIVVFAGFSVLPLVWALFKTP